MTRKPNRHPDQQTTYRKAAGQSGQRVVVMVIDN